MDFNSSLETYLKLQKDYNILMEKYLNLLNEHITLQQKYLGDILPRNPEDAYREDFQKSNL